MKKKAYVERCCWCAIDCFLAILITHHYFAKRISTHSNGMKYDKLIKNSSLQIIFSEQSAMHPAKEFFLSPTMLCATSETTVKPLNYSVMRARNLTDKFELSHLLIQHSQWIISVYPLRVCLLLKMPCKICKLNIQRTARRSKFIQMEFNGGWKQQTNSPMSRDSNMFCNLSRCCCSNKKNQIMANF